MSRRTCTSARRARARTRRSITPRINRLNEKLAALADGKDIFYIDINEVFDDENGNLRADASGDSTHVYAKYDLDWCDWLCTKAIVR